MKKSTQRKFWKNKELVKKTVKQKKIFESIVQSYKNSSKEISNLKDLYNLANQEKDEEILQECNFKIDEIQKILKKSEINCFFIRRK